MYTANILLVEISLDMAKILKKKLATINKKANNSFNCKSYNKKCKYKCRADNFCLLYCKVRERCVSATAIPFYFLLRM